MRLNALPAEGTAKSVRKKHGKQQCRREDTNPNPQTGMQIVAHNNRPSNNGNQADINYDTPRDLGSGSRGLGLNANNKQRLG